MLALAGPARTQDLDRDSLLDGLEQGLLERFVPTLVLSAGECDERQAALRAHVLTPLVAARDGTLYGHVALRTAGPGEPLEIELKYFHLWGRDCGRPSHALDVEHVSALVRAASLQLDAPPDAWQGAYWYAAAHEGTVCDASRGAPATTLRASTTGASVYVSRGKHASYLVRGHCESGCGSDRCDPGEPPHRSAVVNLGELDAPLNGATWLASRRWDLARKPATDFDAGLRARPDRAPGARVQALGIELRPIQSPILGGDMGLDALVEAAAHRTWGGLAWFLRLR